MLTAAPFSKEIRRFKVAVNSACPLRCDYCLLDKDAGETLEYDDAFSAVDFFLASPGRAKKLLLYGGEPMAAFGRVRRIVLHAEAEASRLGRSLCATVATSGVLARPGDLEFMAGHGMHLSVSIDGEPATHDRFRRTVRGAPSHGLIAANLPAFFGALGRDAVTALMCVHPEHAGRMSRDFEHLLSLGFENVNVEVVHGFPWSEAAREAFAREFDAIGARIRSEIEAGRFVFLESFAIPLQREPAAEKVCPFHSCLEVFPSGDFSFYPFPFVEGLESRPRASIGTVRGGLAPRWNDCRFDPDGELCRGCRAEYYRLPRLSEGNEPYELRTRLAERWIAELALRARRDGRCRAYLKEAVRRSALGYR